MSGPRVTGTRIPGLLHVELAVHADERGWFKESWQGLALEAAGAPALDVAQHNVSYNAAVGTTRGIHAEPWDKYVSPASGRVFSAIADLRPGPTYGLVEVFELGPGQALYVPRGCGNAFCTLEPHTVYSYLVNGLWSAQARYVAVDLFDPQLAVPWPLPRERLVISEKDRRNPPLAPAAGPPGAS